MLFSQLMRSFQDARNPDDRADQLLNASEKFRRFPGDHADQLFNHAGKI
jgi:hypothetical protein